MEVNENAKHHTNHTCAYIRNVNEVMAELSSTSSRYSNSYTKMDVCILYDNCVLKPPAFCKNIPRLF
ncbi:hypothetical protein EON63_04170 [archaeon]|nr:MAG: hypothetical protein EON63_04170 [archaeon]